jgi:hypothetical protein
MGWKITIGNARNHALNCEDNVTVEYHLQLLEAVEEAIWAEEIRLQDDASDAKWHDELLRRTTASYELRCRDYVTWFNNYKRRKATEQYRLDRVHQLRRAKANAIIAQKSVGTLTIFLWNRRLRMRWWFNDQAEQRRRISAAQTILLWNRRLRMRWWFDEQTRQRRNGHVVTGSSKLDTRGSYDGVNDGLDDNDGLCNDQRFYTTSSGEVALPPTPAATNVVTPPH